MKTLTVPTSPGYMTSIVHLLVPADSNHNLLITLLLGGILRPTLSERRVICACIQTFLADSEADMAESSLESIGDVSTGGKIRVENVLEL